MGWEGAKLGMGGGMTAKELWEVVHPAVMAHTGSYLRTATVSLSPFSPWICTSNFTVAAPTAGGSCMEGKENLNPLSLPKLPTLSPTPPYTIALVRGGGRVIRSNPSKLNRKLLFF